MKELQRDRDISQLSNFKTPAIAEYYFEIGTESDISILFGIGNFAKKKKKQILFVWAGTNMLFAFEKFEGIVIKNCLEWWSYNPETQTLETYSNELISDISQSLEDDYWQNLWHRFIWLPWSIWWAVFGNAWCFWLELENNFKEAVLFELSSWQLSYLTKDKMNFKYRSSILKENNGHYFLVKATFDLSTKIEKYHSDVDNLYFREYKQPKWNTCGSFFKNPVVSLEWFKKDFPKYCSKDMKLVSAWFLLEQAGLKGYQIWGAFLSPLHSNFLMSDGSATSKDLLDLIQFAQDTVYNKFWIKIENEVRIITS